MSVRLGLLLAAGILLLLSSSRALQASGGSDAYIVAESNGGLANRLRALAAYLFLAEQKYNEAHTIFIWDKNSACPGHFLSLFNPIPKLVFATNSSRELFNKNALVVYNNTMNSFTQIMKENSVGGADRKHQYIHKKHFHPTREIMEKVNDFVKEHNVCNMSAIHIRTTDLDKVMPNHRRTNFWNIYKFMDNRPAGEKVFLLTDDPKTQQHMMEKYGEKIVVYHKIANATEQAALPEDHRYTSLEHTLIDVLVAAHAIKFRAAAFSSLSDLVWLFRFTGTFCHDVLHHGAVK